MTRPLGGSLVELVLVAWLFGLVLAAVGRFAEAQGRLSATQDDRARAAEAMRAAGLVLASELRYLAPGDITAASADSLRLRAIRGAGVVCYSEGRDLLIRYRGARLPDADKDSVMVIAASGRHLPPIPLEGVAADGACGGSLRLTVGALPAEPAAVALVHETGTYHLAGGALRYRMGGAGRQPLTEAIFGEARFHPGGSGEGLSLIVGLDSDSLPRIAPLRYEITLHTLNPWAP